ncbi:MAG: hypothetical protein NTV34_12890 [Proteobacteria bacterium]|nr:hypothetical protein [Pseudomonadota bacterium]
MIQSISLTPNDLTYIPANASCHPLECNYLNMCIDGCGDSDGLTKKSLMGEGVELDAGDNDRMLGVVQVLEKERLNESLVPTSESDSFPGCLVGCGGEESWCP